MLTLFTSDYNYNLKKENRGEIVKIGEWRSIEKL